MVSRLHAVHTTNILVVSRYSTVAYLQGGQKIGKFVVRLNFTKYKPIFKIISLSELGENLQ